MCDHTQMVLMSRLINWQYRIDPSAIPALNDTLRTCWLVNMTAALGMSDGHTTTIYGMTVLTGDVRHRSMAATHEVLRYESDDQR